MAKTIYEKSSSWCGRFRVESRGEKVSWITPYEWYLDREYDTSEAAITRAENFMHKGAEEVRVIDTEANDD